MPIATGEPSAAQAFAALQKLSPTEAVDYLQRRNQVTNTYGWQDLWQEEHAQQFTVSRLARADLMQALQDMNSSLLTIVGRIRSPGAWPETCRGATSCAIPRRC